MLLRFIIQVGLLVHIGPLLAFSLQERETTWPVIGIDLQGAKRTRLSWVETYLGYEFPTVITPSELQTIKQKLLTTQVFTSVEVSVRSIVSDPRTYLIVIKVEEKWTTIPVVRGAFGGGTPLRVFGLYDTHSFGKLWTIGAETRKYGSAPLGGVAWARAPRFMQGHHVHGFEVWREFRIRRIYEDDKEIGQFQSDLSWLRVLFLAPVSHDGVWKAGADLRYYREQPTRYKSVSLSSPEPPDGIKLTREPTRYGVVLSRLVYDDVIVNNVQLDGTRFIASVGPLLGDADIAAKAESEGFYFLRVLSRLNLGIHYLIGQTTTDSLESQYFLGGLDSIRGLPDGALFGNRAAYTNFEIRLLAKKFKYLWLQNVLFLDSGGAGSSWKQAADNVRSSAGVGLRVSIPQVYRLMFRIDYAWSLDRPGTQGISAGMNQFFQPYRPL